MIVKLKEMDLRLGLQFIDTVGLQFLSKKSKDRMRLLSSKIQDLEISIKKAGY